METVGEKIYNLRKEREVSQEELAFALNVSRQTVSRWENNSVKPTDANWESLCAFFEVNSGYFFNTDENEKISEVRDKEKGRPNGNRKLIFLIVVTIFLITCIAVCAFTSYAMLSPIENPSINIRIEHRFNYIGILCAVFGAIAFAILIAMWTVFAFKKKNKKM